MEGYKIKNTKIFKKYGNILQNKRIFGLIALCYPKYSTSDVF